MSVSSTRQSEDRFTLEPMDQDSADGNKGIKVIGHQVGTLNRAWDVQNTFFNCLT